MWRVSEEKLKNVWFNNDVIRRSDHYLIRRGWVRLLWTVPLKQSFSPEFRINNNHKFKFDWKVCPESQRPLLDASGASQRGEDRSICFSRNISVTFCFIDKVHFLCEHQIHVDLLLSGSNWTFNESTAGFCSRHWFIQIMLIWQIFGSLTLVLNVLWTVVIATSPNLDRHCSQV